MNQVIWEVMNDGRMFSIPAFLTNILSSRHFVHNQLSSQTTFNMRSLLTVVYWLPIMLALTCWYLWWCHGYGGALVSSAVNISDNLPHIRKSSRWILLCWWLDWLCNMRQSIPASFDWWLDGGDCSCDLLHGHMR